MYSVTYVSSAMKRLSQVELDDLQTVCARNNRRAGITGMLLYKDGNFMQVLEGEERDVRQLYLKIREDSRHRGIFPLLEGPLAQRDFPSWSMGFRNLATPQSEAVPAFAPFLHSPLTKREFSPDASRARQLLMIFKTTMRG